MKPFVKSWIILFLFTLPIASTAEILSNDSNESTCYGTAKARFITPGNFPFMEKIFSLIR